MITYLVILSKVYYEENTFPQARNYRWEISLFISRSHSLTFPFPPTLRYQNKIVKNFPGGPVVRTQRPNCRRHGLNPDWGTKILQAAQGSPPNKLLNSQPLFYTAVLYQKSLKLEAAVKKKERQKETDLQYKKWFYIQLCVWKILSTRKGG